MIIRVIYPLQSGRIVLRVDDDWNRDVEAASVDAGRTAFEFQYATARPYLYFKPCIVDQNGFHWSKGSNYLAINSGTGIKSIYPHFFGDLGGAISAPIDFYLKFFIDSDQKNIYIQALTSSCVCAFHFPTLR
ncbi:hypothetical protein L0337_22975 [candidate division KSB1 bacterium]|nr:hypothetical protein [candidate division KSB1 bacterium]